MATLQNFIRYYRGATRLLFFFLFSACFRCSTYYRGGVPVLSVLLLCDTLNVAGGPDTPPQSGAPPSVDSNPVHETSLPTAAVAGESGGEEEKSEPRAEDEIDARLFGRTAHTELVDEIVRCEIPSSHVPSVPVFRAFAGINSPDTCQKLCYLNGGCDFVEWDFLAGVCYLKAMDVKDSSLSSAPDLSGDVLVKKDVSELASTGKTQPFIFSSSPSQTFSSGGDRDLFTSTSSVPSKYSFFPVMEGVTSSVPRTAVSSLSHSSSASLSSIFSHFPHLSKNNDVGVRSSPPVNEVAAAAAAVPAPSSLQSSAVVVPDLARTAAQRSSAIILEDLVVPHHTIMVLPPTCTVTCWVFNYTCRHFSSPRASPEGEQNGKATGTERDGRRSQAFHLSRQGTGNLVGGGDMYTVSTTPHDCQRKCQRDESCGAFSWNRNSYRCYFCPASKYPVNQWTNKRTFFSATQSQLKHANEFVTGPKSSCTVSGPTEWVTPIFQPCFHGNKTTHSDSVTLTRTIHHVSAVTDCQWYCYKEPACHHFTWNYATQDCHLKAGSIHDSLVPAHPFISGPKSCLKGCLRRDVMYPKEIIFKRIKTDTVFDCQVACAAHTSPTLCGGVTYYFRTHDCALASAFSSSISDGTPASVLKLSSLASAYGRPASTPASPAPTPPSAEALTSSGTSERKEREQKEQPQTSKPSFLAKELVKSADGNTLPDMPCTMCVSTTASLCQAALPRIFSSRKPASRSVARRRRLE